MALIPGAVFYNFSQINKSSVDQILNKTDTIFHDILAKSNDYLVSVLKFTLPSETQTFIIEDSDDYMVRLSVNMADFTTVNAPHPISRIAANQRLIPSTLIQLRGIDDFLGNVNKALLIAHQNLLSVLINGMGSVNSIVYNVNTPIVFTDITQINVGVDIVLPHPNCQFITVAGVEVDITLTENNPVDATPVYAEFTLINNKSGDRQQVVLTSGCIVPFGKTILFTDKSLNSQNPQQPLSKDDYMPLEPFSKFYLNTRYEEVQVSPWVLQARYRGGRKNFILGANVRIKTVPAFFDKNPITHPQPAGTTSTAFPLLPPIFSFDRTTKEVSLSIDDRHKLSGFQIELSPRLYSVMPFVGNVGSYQGFYILQIPQVSMIHKTLDPAEVGGIDLQVVYPPDQTEIYKMLDIEAIILKTSMPVGGEYSVSTSESILMSIDINPGDLASTHYEFVNNSLSLRQYELLSDLPLRDIGISVFAKYRTTGAVVPMYLPPFTSFNMLIKFAPKVKSFFYASSFYYKTCLNQTLRARSRRRFRALEASVFETETRTCRRTST